MVSTRPTIRAAAHVAGVTRAFTIGGAIVRNDVTALLAGEGGDCTLNGLYLAGGSQLVDNHTIIDHAQPHCGSHEVYKGILDGQAHTFTYARAAHPHPLLLDSAHQPAPIPSAAGQPIGLFDEPLIDELEALFLRQYERHRAARG